MWIPRLLSWEASESEQDAGREAHLPEPLSVSALTHDLILSSTESVLKNPNLTYNRHLGETEFSQALRKPTVWDWTTYVVFGHVWPGGWTGLTSKVISRPEVLEIKIPSLTSITLLSSGGFDMGSEPVCSDQRVGGRAWEERHVLL